MLVTLSAWYGVAPSGGTSSETQIRFGFVPYATNVNVGRLLPPEWFRDFSSYQSRERVVVYGRPVSYVDSDKTDWLWISWTQRSEEHTSELQSLMRISYAVFCFKKKKLHHQNY